MASTETLPGSSSPTGPTDLVLAGGGWLAAALVFYRAVWSSGFRQLDGNAGDTRLIAFLCEHWFAVLHGTQSLTNMPFFYPVKGLVGWSDGFVLYAVVYVPLREIGCGPFLALQLTVMILSAIGFVTFYFLARTWLKAPGLIAVAGAVAFTFSNALYLHVSSSQLSGVYLLPSIALLVRAAGRSLASRRVKAAVLGGLAGILAGLLFLTTYYVAIYSALAVGFALVWTLLLRRGAVREWIHSRPGPARASGAHSVRADPATGRRRELVPVAVSLAAFVIALGPAVAVYLPTRSQLKGPSRQVVLGYAIHLKGVFEVGTDNLLWGPLVSAFHGGNGGLNYEYSYAMTPTLLVAMVVGAIVVCRHRFRRPPLAAVLALTALCLVVLPIKVGGVTLWLILWHIPGFNAIRAIDRIQVMASTVAVLALVAVATELWSWGATALTGRRGGRGWRVAVGVVLVLVVVEQFNSLAVTPLKRLTQDRLLASITPAPPGCRYFYVTYVVNGVARPLVFFQSQIDAMFAADKAGIPTINGYTGYNPSGWTLENVGSPTYLASVAAWEQLHDLGPGVCHLNLASLKWAPG